MHSGSRLHGIALVSVMAALLLTLLLEALDQTVVGVALPKIIGTLQGFDRYTWAVTAYTLASAMMVPTAGKLSDQFGRKWFLVGGTGVFLLGSALAGASMNMDQLIACRALQGLGAGVGIALVFTVVADIFPPAQRVKWQGILGAVYGFSSLVGPNLGGWLTDYGPVVGDFVTDATRWRWVFYVNIPIGAIALAGLFVYLPADLSVRRRRYTGWAAVRRIDFTGTLLAAAATACLLLGLTWGSNAIYDWASPQVIGVLGAAAVLYGLFIVAESVAVEPILPLDLFRNRVFAAASVLSLLQLMVVLGLAVYLPLFLQGVLGVSATSAGAAITPLSLAEVVGAALAGLVILTRKRYQAVTILGACIMTLGTFLLTRVTVSTTLLNAVIYMVIAGVGMGMFFPVLTLAAQNALPHSRLGVGTATVRYLGQLGAVLGIAIVGAVVSSSLSSDIVTRLPPDTVQQLTLHGLEVATNPQVLVNPAYRDTAMQIAEGYARQAAVARAVANVPPGPSHDQTAAAIASQVAAQATQQAQQVLSQVFDVLRLSLAVGIQRGFTAVLLFCGASIVATLFLKDVPMAAQFSAAPDEAGEETRSTTF